MNYGGDAAEQIVRMSLDGVEVAAKITGNGAKHLAIALMAVLKEEKKTTGKARLTNMLRSGKQLNVFSLSEKDLKKFTTEAKKYGVLYCVVKSKHQVGDNTMVDLIVRAEDAPKINRIVENFKLATVNKASILSEVEKAKEAKKQEEQAKSEAESSKQKGKEKKQNPKRAKTEKSPLSEQSSTRAEQNKVGTTRNKKPSVKKQLDSYKEAERKNDKNRNAQKSKNATQKQNTKQHNNKRKKKGKSR